MLVPKGDTDKSDPLKGYGQIGHPKREYSEICDALKELFGDIGAPKGC
jgi:hypothetical protein